MVSRHPSRRGVAEIEFVMVLPIVLLLLLVMLWTGAVAARSGEAAIRARHDAWRQRATAVHGPFDFGDTAGGRIETTVEVPVNVSPVVNGAFVPRSTHVVHGGAWSHTAVDMDQTPNWRLQAIVLRGTAVNVASEIAAVVSNVSALPQAITAAIQEEITKQLAEMSPLIATLLSGFQRAGTDLAAEKQRARSEAIARVSAQIAETKGRLDEEKKRLAVLEADVREAERALPNATAEERTKLEEQLRTLRRQADENRRRQEPLASTITFLEEQKRVTQRQ